MRLPTSDLIHNQIASMTSKLPTIIEQRRLSSPAITPQALAWRAGNLSMGSRDLRRVYAIDPQQGRVIEESDAPGIPWAAVATNGSITFTLGEGEDDDRYLRQFRPGEGFASAPRIACPDFTGSYLSYDGRTLHLSQWYKHRILCLEANGTIRSAIEVGAEISGHTFAGGTLYVLRGTEQDGEKWTISQFDPGERISVKDVARVPFACRSLAFDGERFWTNHRVANEIVAFALPN
jgi:hypothetical protein